MNMELSGVQWCKSSYSGNDECVEVAWFGRGRVAVRDSKDPVGPALMFDATDWDSFVAALRDDSF
ncbi:DUF397 domain-containing protein [Nocardia sp. NPDC050193]